MEWNIRFKSNCSSDPEPGKVEQRERARRQAEENRQNERNIEEEPSSFRYFTDAVSTHTQTQTQIQFIIIMNDRAY